MPPANISTVARVKEDTIPNLSTAILIEQELERFAMRNILAFAWNLDLLQTRDYGTRRLQFTVLSIARCVLRVTTHLVK
jgi:hypothetical protein